jgi:hypothetical protein
MAHVYKLKEIHLFISLVVQHVNITFFHLVLKTFFVLKTQIAKKYDKQPQNLKNEKEKTH